MLIALLLDHWKLLKSPLLYLSLYLKQNQAAYYRWLEAIRTEGDWVGWLRFFLVGVAEIADDVRRDLIAAGFQHHGAVHTDVVGGQKFHQLHDVEPHLDAPEEVHAGHDLRGPVDAVGRPGELGIEHPHGLPADLLVLDEPTSALPENDAEQLLIWIRGLADAGTTCVYISHRMEEVFRIAEGRLKEGGPHKVVPLLSAAVERIERRSDLGEDVSSSGRPPTGLHALPETPTREQRRHLPETHHLCPEYEDHEPEIMG